MTEEDTSEESLGDIDGFSQEPRPGYDEDADMTPFVDSPDTVRAYLPVSGGRGEHLRDVELESEVKACCEEYRHILNAPVGVKILLSSAWTTSLQASAPPLLNRKKGAEYRGLSASKVPNIHLIRGWQLSVRMGGSFA